jgi:excisionase family DNA binding protein
MARNAPDLSDREVADALQKSVRTVQRWCNSGKLSGAYHAGRAWRIPRASLDAAHRDAVGRFERGPIAELREALHVVSQQLTRATQDIAEADLQTIERLIKRLRTLETSVKTTGKLASERRRGLVRDEDLAKRSRSRLSPAKITRG